MHTFATSNRLDGRWACDLCLSRWMTTGWFPRLWRRCSRTGTRVLGEACRDLGSCVSHPLPRDARPTRFLSARIQADCDFLDTLPDTVTIGQNPTGTVIPDDRRRAIYKLACKVCSSVLVLDFVLEKPDCSFSYLFVVRHRHLRGSVFFTLLVNRSSHRPTDSCLRLSVLQTTRISRLTLVRTALSRSEPRRRTIPRSLRPRGMRSSSLLSDDRTSRRTPRE
jgi:hypothetical protein